MPTNFGSKLELLILKLDLKIIDFEIEFRKHRVQLFLENIKKDTKGFSSTIYHKKERDSSDTIMYAFGGNKHIKGVGSLTMPL